MTPFFPLVELLVLFLFLPSVAPFTVVVSDTATPALIDGPQMGYSSNGDRAHTDPREQEAVYDVMRATGNPWATEIPDVCRGRWHGIECMPDKDNVYHVVSLSFGALSDDTAFPTCDPNRARIPESITRLPHLRTLFFYRCFGHNPHPIPAFLGRLGSTLQTLVLRDNGFVGPIPDEFGNLNRLRVLDLHKNYLNGSIPPSLARLSNLRSLDLSMNRLTGSIPVLTAPVLNILDLSQNLLTGPIPSSIGKCQSLLKMDLSRNRLDSQIPRSFKTLNELILMDLSYNRLPGPIPSCLQGLRSLQALILQGNLMEQATIPGEIFRGMNNLIILVLSNMNLQGPIPESLAALPQLRVVHLDGNKLNGSIPETFRRLKHLSELRLNDNKLVGPVPFGKDMFWRMKRKLRLQNNSGLCLNANSELEDVIDSSFNSGIEICVSTGDGSGLSRSVEHLSSLPIGIRESKATGNVLSLGWWVGVLMPLLLFGD